MIADLLISALLVIGGLFGLIGAFGLLKLRAPMQRLHAPTKATTVGVGSALIASAATAALGGGAPWQEAMVVIFLFLTAPLTALYLAKAHLHGTIDRADVPKPETGDWAGYTPPHP
jgi:multicomponent K+:H+ antiporter subunit G